MTFIVTLLKLSIVLNDIKKMTKYSTSYKNTETKHQTKACHTI